MEFLSASGGRTQKSQIMRAGETLTGVCGSLRDPDGGRIYTWRGRISSPDPSIRHAKKVAKLLLDFYNATMSKSSTEIDGTLARRALSYAYVTGFTDPTVREAMGNRSEKSGG